MTRVIRLMGERLVRAKGGGLYTATELVIREGALTEIRTVKTVLGRTVRATFTPDELVDMESIALVDGLEPKDQRRSA